MVTAVVARRQTQPFVNPSELAELGALPPRVSMNPGISIYTLRATARLRLSNGAYSDVVRTAAATIQLPNPRRIPRPPLQVLRWQDDAWSQAAIPPFDGMVVTGGNVPGQPGFVGSGVNGALQP